MKIQTSQEEVKNWHEDFGSNFVLILAKKGFDSRWLLVLRLLNSIRNGTVVIIVGVVGMIISVAADVVVVGHHLPTTYDTMTRFAELAFEINIKRQTDRQKDGNSARETEGERERENLTNNIPRYLLLRRRRRRCHGQNIGK